MAEGNIPKPIIIAKTYSVTTVNNAMVSPFGAYKEINLTNDVSSYGNIVGGITLSSSTNPSVIKMINTKQGVHVYSQVADTFNVIVVFGNCPFI